MLLTFISILGCKDTDENVDRKGARGELMGMIGRENGRETTEQVGNAIS